MPKSLREVTILVLHVSALLYLIMGDWNTAWMILVLTFLFSIDGKVNV